MRIAGKLLELNFTKMQKGASSIPARYRYLVAGSAILLLVALIQTISVFSVRSELSAAQSRVDELEGKVSDLEQQNRRQEQMLIELGKTEN